MKESEYRTNLGSEELLNKEYSELYFESDEWTFKRLEDLLYNHGVYFRVRGKSDVPILRVFDHFVLGTFKDNRISFKLHNGKFENMYQLSMLNGFIKDLLALRHDYWNDYSVGGIEKVVQNYR